MSHISGNVPIEVCIQRCCPKMYSPIYHDNLITNQEFNIVIVAILSAINHGQNRQISHIVIDKCK